MVKQSSSLASPPASWNVVASTSVPSTYSREEWYDSAAGSMVQWPPRSQSSSRPKTAPPSKRGKQHQSIDAVLETRAAVWQSPISA